jgi:hypothetical protein
MGLRRPRIQVVYSPMVRSRTGRHRDDILEQSRRNPEVTEAR